MKQIRLQKEPKLIAKFKAFPYQKEAVDAVKDLDYAAILHEQGLGKTKIAIDIMLYWLDNTSIDTVLVVTKKQLIANWVNEFRTHTYIKPGVLDSNHKNDHYILCGPYRAVITNFEVLVTEKEEIKLYLQTRNVAIVIDESAKLKNPNSKLTQTFFELSTFFKKKVIMTGTPVANRPYDIWAQIYFLDHGKSLGSNFLEFKKNTDLNNKLANDENSRETFVENVSGIFSKISTFTVRETKNSGIITLPDKVYLQEEVVLDEHQRVLYNQICEELRVEVVKNGITVIDDSSAVVKRLLRLVQVVSNPKMIDESYCGESSKEKKLDQVLNAILSKHEKAIVWSNFIENVNYLTHKYLEYGAVKIHGGMNISERNKSVEKFKNDDYKVLFATPASAKEGLTLTMANHVVFYDRGFSLDDYLQAQDRIHRISQTRTCYVHNLIAVSTIDEWIDSLLVAKQDAAHLAQGDISVGKYKKISDFSYGDLIREILHMGDN